MYTHMHARTRSPEQVPLVLTPLTLRIVMNNVRDQKNYLHEQVRTSGCAESTRPLSCIIDSKNNNTSIVDT